MSNYSDEPGKDRPKGRDSREAYTPRGVASLLSAVHLLLMMFAGWVNRHQLDVIGYSGIESRAQGTPGRRRIR